MSSNHIIAERAIEAFSGGLDGARFWGSYGFFMGMGATLMDLLFRREQAPGAAGIGLPIPIRAFGLGAPRFKLWAKVELSPEEQGVVDHYHFDEAVLIDAIQPELLRKTAIIGGAVWVVAAMLLWTVFSFGGAVFWGLIAGGVAAYFYYDKSRETVFVKDLLHGRHFMCGSVVELARKEAWLETVTGFLRQVMESAKNWGGTEAIKIEALPKDIARQIILKGL